MAKILEVTDLRKYFRVKRGMLHAVDGVSFSVEKGKTLGVVGESGCGKSTLGRVILRLQSGAEGSVRFEGQELLSKTNANILKNHLPMQMIFQDPYASLNPRMSVYEIIEEPLLIHKLRPSREAVRARVKELMDRVGLEEGVSACYPHELDGGRRQRVGIARALALEPKFLVCDEPVSALDVSIQAQILNLLQDLQEEENLTYLFISHDLSVVKHVSDDILVMYLGLVVEHCPTEELFAAPLHPYTQALLAAIPEPTLHKTRKRIRLAGEVTTPIDPPPGCRFAPRCPRAAERCRRETPLLQAVRPGHFVACHGEDRG